MHKDDQMTPNERMDSLFSGKEVDRLPAMPFVGLVCERMIGMTHREMRSSAVNFANAQIVCYEELGHDSISIEYGLHGVGHACGSVWNDPENGVPAIIEHVMKNLDDMDKLDLDMISRKKDSWFDLNCEACERCVDKVGKEVGVSVVVPGPFTAAASLLPVEKLLKASRRQPEKVHELLRFCTGAIKILVKEFTKCGGDIFLCDPVASGNMIGRREYCEFVLPYTIEITEYIHECGKAMGYHICGDTNAITLDMLKSGCDMLSVDTKVKLSDARRLAGDKVPIIGNVDPIDTMMLGTVEDVYENIKKNVKDCWDSPCGYIVSTGCDIPLNSPMENVYAFMDGVRKYARYPIL